MRIDLIAAPKILSEPFADDRLIWTQPTVTSSEVSVPVALDLLEVCVPVSARSNLAKVRHLTAEVDNHPKITVGVVAVAGVARVVIVAVAITTAAIVVVVGTSILKGAAGSAMLRSCLRHNFSDGCLKGRLVWVSPGGIRGGRSDTMSSVHSGIIKGRRRF